MALIGPKLPPLVPSVQEGGERIRVEHRVWGREGPLPFHQRLRNALCWPEPIDVHALLAREPLRDRVGKPVQFRGTGGAEDTTVYGFYFYQRNEYSQAFGPDFQQTYLKLRDQGADFDVIFCSLDQSFTDYQLTSQATPHWIKFAHNDARVMEIAEACDIDSGPALVLVDGRTGTVIARDASLAAMADPQGQLFPWHGAQRPIYRRHPYWCGSLAAFVGILIPRTYFRWIK